jgi:hypothetical protein
MELEGPARSTKWIQAIAPDVKLQAHFFDERAGYAQRKSGVPGTHISRGFGQLREIRPSFFV